MKNSRSSESTVKLPVKETAGVPAANADAADDAPAHDRMANSAANRALLLCAIVSFSIYETRKKHHQKRSKQAKITLENTGK